MPRVRAGFIPAFPPVPYGQLEEIIAFFRKMLPMEAAAVIYRSLADGRYCTYIPRQTVSAAGVDFTLPDMDREKFLPFLEIHSHNTMCAFFSETDDSVKALSVMGKWCGDKIILSKVEFIKKILYKRKNV